MLPAAHKTVVDLANAIWHGFDFFPHAMPTATCQYYLLCLLFLRAVSTMPPQDAATMPANTSPSKPTWQQYGLLVPHEAQMGLLFVNRAQPGNGERIDRALAALTFLNPTQLGTRLTVVSFDSPLLGGPGARDTLLSALLCHFMQEELRVVDQQPALFGEVFSEVLRLFAVHHHACTQYFTSPQPDIELDMTPQPVAQLMARLLDPMPGDMIYDPAFGMGSMLLAAAQSSRRTHGGVPRILYGQESNAERCAVARMRLSLFGLDTSHLVYGDALTRGIGDDDATPSRCPRPPESIATSATFDVVLSAPPIVVVSAAAEGDPASTSVKHTGLGFAQTMLTRLTPQTGRMGILLPVSAFTRSDQRDMREQLVRANAIDSVIFLPPCLLQHYPEAACIVLMRRCPAYVPVFIVDARQLGVNAAQLTQDTAERSPVLSLAALHEEVIDQIAHAFLPKRDIPGFARHVTWAELGQVKYDFTSPLLIDPRANSVPPATAQETAPELSIQ